MHQGRMFSSQFRYTWRCGRSGWKRSVPSFAAAIAGSARRVMSQNHCSEMSGSIRCPERCECGTSCTNGWVPDTSPSARSAATTALRASSTCSPSKSPPAAAVMRASSPITLTSSSPCARPISKSFGSWPGVILSAPVPNSGSTYSSAMIGSRRPTSGRIACSPIRRV